MSVVRSSRQLWTPSRRTVSSVIDQRATFYAFQCDRVRREVQFQRAMAGHETPIRSAEALSDRLLSHDVPTRGQRASIASSGRAFPVDASRTVRAADFLIVSHVVHGCTPRSGRCLLCPSGGRFTQHRNCPHCVRRRCTGYGGAVASALNLTIEGCDVGAKNAPSIMTLQPIQMGVRQRPSLTTSPPARSPPPRRSHPSGSRGPMLSHRTTH